MRTMDWIEFISKVGFPIAIVAVCVTGAYRLANAVGFHVVIPIVRGHLDFIEQLKIFLREMHGYQYRQEASHKDTLNLLQSLEDKVDAQTKMIDDLGPCRWPGRDQANDSRDRPA
jgi:hypothetical protein